MDIDDMCKGLFDGVFDKEASTSWLLNHLDALNKEYDYELMRNSRSTTSMLGNRCQELVRRMAKEHFAGKHVPNYTYGVGCTAEEATFYMEEKDPEKKRGKNGRIVIVSPLDKEKIMNHFGTIKNSIKKEMGPIDKSILQWMFDTVHNNIDDFMSDELHEFNCDLLLSEPENSIIAELKLSADKDDSSNKQMYENLILPYIAYGSRSADVMFGIMASNKEVKELADIFSESGYVLSYGIPSGISAFSRDLIRVETELFERLFNDASLFNDFKEAVCNALNYVAEQTMIDRMAGVKH